MRICNLDLRTGRLEQLQLGSANLTKDLKNVIKLKYANEKNQVTNVSILAPKMITYLFIIRVCRIIAEDEPVQAGSSDPELIDADLSYDYEGRLIS